MPPDIKKKEMGDAAYHQREKLRLRKAFWIQAGVIVLILVCLIGLGFNITANLDANKVKTGFSFFADAAGFDIGERSLPFESSDSFIWALVVGLANTIRVAGIGIITATALGIVVGLMRLSRHPLIRFMGTAHVEFYRNIPLLVLLLALYLSITELLPRAGSALHIGNWIYLSKAGVQYATPVLGWTGIAISLIVALIAFVISLIVSKRYLINQMAIVLSLGVASVAFVLGWVLCGALAGWDHPEATRFALRGGGQLTPEFLTLWLGLTLFTSASIAEIVRAGVISVPRGQWDAGLALGLSRWETVCYIIFPQSMRLVIPPLASQYMNLTKNSSLAVLVGYPDLVSIANTTINVSAQSIEVILVIMVVYLILNLLISLVMNIVNARFTRCPI